MCIRDSGNVTEQHKHKNRLKKRWASVRSKYIRGNYRGKPWKRKMPINLPDFTEESDTNSLNAEYINILDSNEIQKRRIPINPKMSQYKPHRNCRHKKVKNFCRFHQFHKRKLPPQANKCKPDSKFDQIECKRHRPVSYTHLDVYKRQPLHSYYFLLFNIFYF